MSLSPSHDGMLMISVSNRSWVGNHNCGEFTRTSTGVYHVYKTRILSAAPHLYLLYFHFSSCDAPQWLSFVYQADTSECQANRSGPSTSQQCSRPWILASKPPKKTIVRRWLGVQSSCIELLAQECTRSALISGTTMNKQTRTIFYPKSYF